jgi:hypothetical protein
MPSRCKGPSILNSAFSDRVRGLGPIPDCLFTSPLLYPLNIPHNMHALLGIFVYLNEKINILIGPVVNQFQFQFA